MSKKEEKIKKLVEQAKIDYGQSEPDTAKLYRAGIIKLSAVAVKNGEMEEVEIPPKSGKGSRKDELKRRYYTVQQLSTQPRGNYKPGKKIKKY